MVKKIYCNIVFPIPIKQKYTYYLPEEIANKESDKKNFVGYRVIVDFGKQKNKIGIIVEVFTKLRSEIELKPVKSTVEDFPFFSQEQILSAQEQANKHFTSIGMFLNEFFPIEHKYTFQQAIITTKDIKKFKFDFDKDLTRLLEKTVDQLLFIPRNVNEKFNFYFNTILYALNNESQLIVVFPTNEYITDFMNFMSSVCKDEKFLSILRKNIFLYTGSVDLKERYKIWCMFKTGQIKVVLSTKIGVFLPFDNVSYIIVDEPDLLGYKNPEVPMYNAVTVLEERLKRYKCRCKLIYSSFVPSVEYMYKLHSKILSISSGQPQTNIKVQFSKRAIKEVIMKNLYKFKQSIVIFPYKGFSKYIFCVLCKKVFFYTKRVYEVCPSCGGKHFVEYSSGGKKFVDMLSSMFKDATIEYFDADTKEEKVKSIIDNFNNEKIDILVTTPVIFSYIYRINFSNVGSVYFSYLDSFLYRPSYLSYETVYKMVKLFEILLSSNTSSAEIFLELFHMDKHNEVLLLSYDAFVKKELEIRRELGYPPFSHIIHIGVVGRCNEELNHMVQKIEQMLKKHDDILVFPKISKDKQVNKKVLEMQLIVKILKNVDKNLKKVVEILTTIADVKQQQNIYIDYKPIV